MKRILTPAVFLILLVAAAGVAHGIKVDRWGKSGELRTATERLDRMPNVVGDWVGSEVQVDPKEMMVAGVDRAAFRTYFNPRLGTRISVLLECGRGGPISVHTPEVCYAGAGFRLDGQQDRLTSGNEESAFWSASFSKIDSALPQQLLVLWAWSRDGKHWSAPENARKDFARFPAVYKLYIVREVTPTRFDERSVREFIDLFTEELSR